eukprot:Gregarina_sp_Poly_1__343@NODE_1083_length_5153_cov_180_372198_g752_i0_p2_GENE_NODE_1083_length_5153_cov_180_372198_g752_i0NODE_1083_length_5153_cov_180_372198_g752_i0_p2_ORF_typecomplete_len807_score116_80Cullin/PF00888_22/1_6e52Cullin_Nedd8/PF10557_9/2_9e03Cullin_Nedd8/PF10557_9/6_1e17LCD1/PF09798_9/0_052FUSC/PF04632_12/0_58_NODE_1083_length_5153_cov_180_372198_g752_i026915111
MASPQQFLPLIAATGSHQLTEEERARKWDFLSAAIDRFPSDDVKSLSFEELYRTAYELVLRGEGEFLYSQVQRRLAEACLHMVSVLTAVPSDAKAEFCNSYKTELAKYHRMVAHMGDILLYMERRYCQHTQKPTVRILAGIELRLKVFEQSTVGKRASDLVAHYVNEMRCATDLERVRATLPLAGVEAIINSTTEFDSSATKFAFHRLFIGEPLFAHSETWFREDVERALSHLDGIQFLEHIAMRVELEPRILELVGLKEKSMKTRLQKSIVKAYVEEKCDWLFSSPEISLAVLFPARQISVASLLYKSVRQCSSALNRLVECFTEELTSEGLNLLKKEKGRAAISALAALRRDAIVFVAEAFAEDAAMRKCIRKSLEKMSTHRQLLSRTLVTALHETLHELETSQVMQSQALERLTSHVEEDVLEPFRALRDKDAFEFHYRNDLISRFLNLLARRFIDDSEGSDCWGRDALELENRALQFFLTECGTAYTQKCQGFFDDVRASQEFQTKLTQPFEADANISPHDHFQVIVLASSRWVRDSGTRGHASILSVPDMQSWLRAYETKYKLAFHNRMLIWHPEFGRAIVRFTPREGVTVDIQCSTTQAMFLLLFEQHRTLRWKQIKELLKIDTDPTNHYLRHFMGLVVHKEARLLKPVEGGKLRRVEEDDEFCVNLDLTVTKRRLAARVVSSKTKGFTSGNNERAISSDEFLTQQETLENPNGGVMLGASGLPLSVEQNRNTVVDAAIVRIMKAKRKLTHLELVTSLNEMLKAQFLPPTLLVKERVSYLIEREFLQRDANHHETYHYVA